MADQEDVNQENMKMKKDKKKLEKEINALETALEKQEERLSHLQTSAFQLANYYFVFQGVILAALSNRNTALRCSDRWFLSTLSALAAALNLAALFSIGSKYNRIANQKARTWSKCNRLQAKLSTLEELDNQQQQCASRNLSGISIKGSLDAANLVQGSNDNRIPAQGKDYVYVDKCDVLKRRAYLSVCLLFFVAFAIIVFVGCFKILCRD